MPGRHADRWRWLRQTVWPETLRPDLAVAARGILGLMVPVLIGRAFNLPALDLAGTAALLLTFGDVTGPEEPRQFARLGLATVLGAAALATGVLAGSQGIFAVTGMLVWGTVAGLLGIYGNAVAALGMPMAWAYFELGLKSPSHDPGQAITLAAWYLGGGLWAICLASVLTAIGPYRPLREQTAECYTQLARYLEDELRAGSRPTMPDAVSPETHVRQAIAKGRLLALRTRQRQHATSVVGQRLVALIELADQLFSVGATLGDLLRSGRGPGGVGDRDAVLIQGLRMVPSALARRCKADAMRPLIDRLDRLANEERPTDPTEALPQRLASGAAQALHAATGDAFLYLADVGTVDDLKVRWDLITPLCSHLTWDSAVLRHALRFAVVTAVAVAIQRWWNPPFGYWIPLTVSVVLKPYAGSTLARSTQRLAGTLAGVAVGLALQTGMGGWLAQAALASVTLFLMMAVLPINYAWVVFFLSAGIIPLETMLTAAVSWQVALFRVLNTCAGGLLALAGGYWLWPAFEGATLPALAAVTLRAMGVYAERVLGEPRTEVEVERAHRQAGLATSNLQAAFQRVVGELDREGERFQAWLRTVVLLQRLLVSLSALRTIRAGRGTALVVDGAFSEWVVQTLESVGQRLVAGTCTNLGQAAPPLPRPRESRMPDRALIERIGWQVRGLQRAVCRL